MRTTARAIGFGLLGLLALNNAVLAADPPNRCAGYGALQSISLTNWESGLGQWTAGTHDVANANTFDTPAWASVGSLPGGRGGKAAFVANLDQGDCGSDNETGALSLDSPTFMIPANVDVPRISLEHWFQTEFGWDGGNIKISVNGGAFNLLPASAIEYGPYNDTLLPAQDEFGLSFNTNPLAGQKAYTGTITGGATGSWAAVRINLLGIAAGGDSVRLRLDFGVDACDGEIGWYVDDVEVYSCTEEQPPSDCGNRVINQGEQCDDGNDFVGDGCSNTCQVESGWQCSAPTPAGTIADGGFEAGTPNPSWTETSNNSIGTPICSTAVCGTGGGSGPEQGTYWAWFGGVPNGTQEGSLSQSVVIPQNLEELTFDLEVPRCDSSADYLEVLVDGHREWVTTGSGQLCGEEGYVPQSVDIRSYANGASHVIQFHSKTFANNQNSTNFFVDQVRLPAAGSQCTQSGVTKLTLVKKVVNDDGGTAQASAWTLTASGPTGFSGAGPSVSSNDNFQAGSYDLSESGGPSGYNASAWSCTGGNQVDQNTISLAAGQSATCTITNDDVAPTLRLVKTIVNDNGGTVTNPNDFGLRIDDALASNNSIYVLAAGNHKASEDGLPGYQPGLWGGDCQTDGSIKLNPGKVAVCTITNDDNDPEYQINIGHSGAWFTPATSGQGQFIDVEPATQFIFFAWFTYTESDSANPFEQRWLTAEGNYVGNFAELTLYESEGGKFDDPQTVSTVPVGEITLDFQSCEQAIMTYRIDTEDLEGEMPLSRPIPQSGNVCTRLKEGASLDDLDINISMDGGWHDSNTSGQGFLMDVHSDPSGDNFIFVGWFTYGDFTASGQRWLTAEGHLDGSTADLIIYDTNGGIFDNPQPVTSVVVGSMKIEFTDCEHAVLTYSIPDEGLEGDINIHRTVPGTEAFCEQLIGGN